MLQYETDEYIIDLERAEQEYSNEQSQQVPKDLKELCNSQIASVNDHFFKTLLELLADCTLLRYAFTTRLQLVLKVKSIHDALLKLRSEMGAQQQPLQDLLALFQLHSLSQHHASQLQLLGKQLKGILLTLDMIDKPILHAFCDRHHFDLVMRLYTTLPPFQLANLGDGSLQHISVLSKCAAQGRVDVIQFCLKQECSSNLNEYISLLTKRDGLNMLPIYYAYLCGQLDTVRFILEQIFQLDHADIPCMLSAACQGARVQLAQYLLELYHGKVPRFDKSKEHEALFQGQLPSVWACSDLNEQLSDLIKQLTGSAPVTKQEHKKRMQLVQLLQQYKLNFVPPKGQFTPLHAATKSGNVDLVRLLATHYPSLLEQEDDQSLRAIHYSVQHFTVFKILYEEFKCKIDFQGEDGAYMLCNSFHQVQVFKYLVDRNAPIEAQVNETGTRIIHMASEQGAFEAVKILMERGVDPHVTDAELCNSLHYAARSDNAQLVKFLLEEVGVSLITKNSQGSTAFHVALLYNVSTEVMLLFLNCNKIVNAIGINDPLNQDFLSHTYPLHHAISMRDVALVQGLLERNAKVDQEMQSTTGSGDDVAASVTPIQLLVDLATCNDGSDELRQGEQSIAKLLLKHGAPMTPALQQLAKQRQWKLLE